MLEQSAIWDMATMRQRALLKALDSREYERLIDCIIQESGNDIHLIEPLLREALEGSSND